MTTAITVSHRHQTSQPKYPKIQNEQGSAIDHAVRLIHAICGLAGSATLIDDIRADLRADKVLAAIRNHDTGPVFDWLMAALSYPGRTEGVRKIAERFGVDASTVQRISRPFGDASAAVV